LLLGVGSESGFEVAVGASSATVYQVLTVLSWNIHAIRGIGTRRLARVVSAIGPMEADVVLLQEVGRDPELVDRVREGLAGIGEPTANAAICRCRNGPPCALRAPGPSSSSSTWIESRRDKVDPRGPLDAAIGYCDDQRVALRRSLDDGRLGLDNNVSEAQLRNAGARELAQAGAVAFSAARRGRRRGRGRGGGRGPRQPLGHGGGRRARRICAGCAPA
jgi:hypothetical protein